MWSFVISWIEYLRARRPTKPGQESRNINDSRCGAALAPALPALWADFTDSLSVGGRFRTIVIILIVATVVIVGVRSGQRNLI